MDEEKKEVTQDGEKAEQPVAEEVKAEPEKKAEKADKKEKRKDK